MKNNAVPILMAGVIILTLFNVINLTAGLPQWASVCATIIGTLFVVCGIFIVISSKKKMTTLPPAGHRGLPSPIKSRNIYLVFQ